MKVVSMVPSWTEMLIECGVNVAGRTRFCVHPHLSVKQIPVVGGTKDVDWEKLKLLGADLLILDQEENPRSMCEESPIPYLATHVTSLLSVAGEIRKISAALSRQRESLESVAQRWEAVADLKCSWNWQKIPGEKDVIRRDHSSYQKLVYVIWKNPWMAVARETFIGSMLSQLGAGKMLPFFETKYPEFRLEDFNLQTTYFLFSSEPFPFHKKIDELKTLGVQGSIVDGESFSWFGTRALRFLESSLVR